MGSLQGCVLAMQAVAHLQWSVSLSLWSPLMPRLHQHLLCSVACSSCRMGQQSCLLFDSLYKLSFVLLAVGPTEDLVTL